MQLMRRAADILSSAPAMQIRYLEAMQAMAKSSNSKVIFMPGPANGGDFGVPIATVPEGESSSQGGDWSAHRPDPVQQLVNSRVIESM